MELLGFFVGFLNLFLPSFRTLLFIIITVIICLFIYLYNVVQLKFIIK